MCVSSFFNKPLCDGPAVSPSSSTDYLLCSGVPSSSTPCPMFPLVALGVMKGSRKDRTPRYFHLLAVPAAAPLFGAFLLSLI